MKRTTKALGDVATETTQLGQLEPGVTRSRTVPRAGAAWCGRHEFRLPSARFAFPQRDTNEAPVIGPGLAAGAIFGLRVMKTGDMVSLVGRENYTLGRAAGSQAIVPDVDHDTYGAQDQGFSRLHAEIRLDETGIHVVDLDSVNGTLINGKRIEPQEPKEILNKDIIQLGNMQLQVVSRIRG